MATVLETMFSSVFLLYENSCVLVIFVSKNPIYNKPSFQAMNGCKPLSEPTMEWFSDVCMDELNTFPDGKFYYFIYLS